MAAMTLESNVSPLAGRFGVADADEPRTPPHNVEAEQALLGAILMNNDAAQRVTDFLKPTHFYEPVHGRIYEVALALIDRGQVADAVTAKHYFEADGALEQIGGAQYLAHLAASATSMMSVEHYGRVVYDLALRRELIRIGEDMGDRACLADLDDDALKQIESAEQDLFTLAETGSRERGLIGFAEALAGAIEQADAAYKRDGQLVGQATGLADLDRMLGGLHPSDLLVPGGAAGDGQELAGRQRRVQHRQRLPQGGRRGGRRRRGGAVQPGDVGRAARRPHSFRTGADLPPTAFARA